MLVLDTNHFAEYERSSEAGARLRSRLDAATERSTLTIVTVEEQLRGWLAEIRRHDDLDRQIVPYAKLQRQVASFANWTILPWSAEAAENFRRMRRQGVRIGTMDLKIASICLTCDAILLTRNFTDFQRVPGLRVENWLD